MGLLLAVAGCGGGADAPPASGVLAGTATEASSLQAIAQPGVSAQAAQPAAAARRMARPYHRKGVTAIAAGSDGKAVAVAHADGRIRMLDPASAGEIKSLKGPGGAAAVGVVFSNGSRYVIAAGRDSVAYGWRVDTGEPSFTLHGHEHPLRAAAASADGELVATAGDETRVLLWNGTTGKLLNALGGHTTFVDSLAFSPNGQRLASGDELGRILVWDTASGRLLHTLAGHADEVNALAFSADGNLLASAAEDGKVLLWDVAAGRQAHAFTGQQAPVRSLAFDRAGARLAGGAADGHVLVWDMTTRTLTQDLARSATGINAVAFAQEDGSSLLAGNETHDVLTWRLPGRR
jgi:WD40 repeat protein